MSGGYVTIRPADSLAVGVGTAGTASAAVVPAGQEVLSVSIIAMPSNTGTVFVGPSSVTTSDGWPLTAGQSMDVQVRNLNSVYAIGSAASQLYRWIATLP